MTTNVCLFIFPFSLQVNEQSNRFKSVSWVPDLFKMEDNYQNRTAFIKGAKDIAKEVKRHASKKVGRTVDRMNDEYSKRSYSRFEEDDDDDYPVQGSQDGGYYRGDSQAANDDEGGSDSTEGHDEDDEIYEGEYQGIPRADSGKGSLAGGPGSVKADAQQFRDIGASEAERRKDQEELAQQYETILQECGHGKFQWTLYFVLGLALMADGVEIFVVGFVLPSAEKDMCLSEPNKSMLGRTLSQVTQPSPSFPCRDKNVKRVNLSSLPRTDCIFRDDGWGFPLGGSC